MKFNNWNCLIMSPAAADIFSLVVVHLLCIWEFPGSIPSWVKPKFEIGCWSSLVSKWEVQYENWLTHCQKYRIMWLGRISYACLWCYISAKQHYKVVIIPSVTIRHHPDMTWNVLKYKKNTKKTIKILVRFLNKLECQWPPREGILKKGLDLARELIKLNTVYH